MKEAIELLLKTLAQDNQNRSHSRAVKPTTATLAISATPEIPITPATLAIPATPEIPITPATLAIPATLEIPIPAILAIPATPEISITPATSTTLLATPTPLSVLQQKWIWATMGGLLLPFAWWLWWRVR